MRRKSGQGTRSICEMLDARRLLTTYAANDFSAPVGTSSESSYTEDGSTGTSTHTSARTTYNGVPCVESDFETDLNGDTSTESVFGAATSKGSFQLEEKVQYSDGNLLEFQTPQSPTVFPAEFTLGASTTYSKIPFQVVEHTADGKIVGSGQMSVTINVVGFERVDAGYVFADALKLIIHRVRSYDAKRRTVRNSRLRMITPPMNGSFAESAWSSKPKIFVTP